MAATWMSKCIRSGFTLSSGFCKKYPGSVISRTNRPYCADSDQVKYTNCFDRKIAYRYIDGSNPGIVFLPGWQSTMDGTKAKALTEYCKKRKLAYVRFDYSGKGMSSGDLRDGTLTDWKEDALAVLDQLTAGPQILVGSSMGGWISLLVAMARPHRTHAVVGISTAADFLERAYNSYPKQVWKDLKEHGEATLESEYGTYLVTQKLLDDAKNHDILKMDKIPINCQVRLIHGMRDKCVPFEVSIKLAQKIWSNDVSVFLRKSGDHRLSQSPDIQMLFEELDYLVFGAKDVQQLAISSWSSITPGQTPPPDS